MAKLTECKPVTFYVTQAAQGCEVEKWSKTEAEENADSILGAFQDEEAARDAILDKDECQQDSGAYQGEESPFENGAWRWMPSVASRTVVLIREKRTPSMTAPGAPSEEGFRKEPSNPLGNSAGGWISTGKHRNA